MYLYLSLVSKEEKIFMRIGKKLNYSMIHDSVNGFFMCFRIVNIVDIDFSKIIIITITQEKNDTVIENTFEYVLFVDANTFYFRGIKCSDLSFEDT